MLYNRSAKYLYSKLKFKVCSENVAVEAVQNKGVTLRSDATA